MAANGYIMLYSWDQNTPQARRAADLIEEGDVAEGVHAGQMDGATRRAPHLTKSNEDYIESIYRIMQEHNAMDGVRSVDVAEQLAVSKASVNKAVSTLRDAGYVEQNRYGRIQLTDTGLVYAKRVWRCHRMLRLFLVRDLGVDPKVADEEACLMEHALSDDTQDRWLAYLEKQGIAVED